MAYAAGRILCLPKFVLSLLGKHVVSLQVETGCLCSHGTLMALTSLAEVGMRWVLMAACNYTELILMIRHLTSSASFASTGWLIRHWGKHGWAGYWELNAPIEMTRALYSPFRTSFSCTIECKLPVVRMINEAERVFRSCADST